MESSDEEGKGRPVGYFEEFDAELARLLAGGVCSSKVIHRSLGPLAERQFGHGTWRRTIDRRLMRLASRGVLVFDKAHGGWRLTGIDRGDGNSWGMNDCFRPSARSP